LVNGGLLLNVIPGNHRPHLNFQFQIDHHVLPVDGDQQRLHRLAPFGVGQFAAYGLPGQGNGAFVVLDLIEEFRERIAAVFGFALLEGVQVLVELVEGIFEISHLSLFAGTQVML